MDDRTALEALRLSVMRIAQATEEGDVIKLIPGNSKDGSRCSDAEAVKIDRGWNRLALEIQAWIEEGNSDY